MNIDIVMDRDRRSISSIPHYNEYLLDTWFRMKTGIDNHLMIHYDNDYHNHYDNDYIIIIIVVVHEWTLDNREKCEWYVVINYQYVGLCNIILLIYIKLILKCTYM